MRTISRAWKRPRPAGRRTPRSMVRRRRSVSYALWCHAGRNRARDPPIGRAPAPRHRARWTTLLARIDRTTQGTSGGRAIRRARWLALTSHGARHPADGRRLLLTYRRGSGSSDVFVRALDQDAIRIARAGAAILARRPIGAGDRPRRQRDSSRCRSAPASRERSRPAPSRQLRRDGFPTDDAWCWREPKPAMAFVCTSRRRQARRRIRSRRKALRSIRTRSRCRPTARSRLSDRAKGR